MKAKRSLSYFAKSLLIIFIAAMWFVCLGPAIQAARDVFKGYQHYDDEYHELATGSLLRDLMGANNQRWPSDWDGLEQLYENSDSRYTYSYEGANDFGDLPERIEIDFSFAPASLAFPENYRHGRGIRTELRTIVSRSLETRQTPESVNHKERCKQDGLLVPIADCEQAR